MNPNQPDDDIKLAADLRELGAAYRNALHLSDEAAKDGPSAEIDAAILAAAHRAVAAKPQKAQPTPRQNRNWFFHWGLAAAASLVAGILITLPFVRDRQQSLIVAQAPQEEAQHDLAGQVAKQAKPSDMAMMQIPESAAPSFQATAPGEAEQAIIPGPFPPPPPVVTAKPAAPAPSPARVETKPSVTPAPLKAKPPAASVDAIQIATSGVLRQEAPTTLAQEESVVSSIAKEQKQEPSQVTVMSDAAGAPEPPRELVLSAAKPESPREIALSAPAPETTRLAETQDRLSRAEPTPFPEDFPSSVQAPSVQTMPLSAAAPPAQKTETPKTIAEPSPQTRIAAGSAGGTQLSQMAATAPADGKMDADFMHDPYVKQQDIGTRTIWQTINLVEQQIPFSKRKIETALGTELIASREQVFYESGPIDLANGVVISSADFRLTTEQADRGFLLLHIDGACITQQEIGGFYPDLVLTQSPSRPTHGMANNTTAYSASRHWGQLSFGFEIDRPDCLAYIAFDPDKKP